MAGHDVVVIGGSAGGVEALKQVCTDLPKDFPAAVCAVLHLSPSSRSFLPELISRASKLPARHPVDGELLKPGTIYIAPPDLHMLVRPGHVILRRGPHENRSRPAINPLFRSAAVSYRSRVIGVVLSGTLDDGAAGLAAIKICGGICVVQDPEDAIWPEMQRNALKHDHVDHKVPIAMLGNLLTRLVQESPSAPMPPIPTNLILEAKIAALETFMPDQVTLGRPTRLSCPRCGGVLNEITEEGSTRFRCQVGHAFTEEALMAAQNDELERALESAMRIHRDRVSLFRRMQHVSEQQSMPHAAARWQAGADESDHAATLISQVLDILRRPPE